MNGRRGERKSDRDASTEKRVREIVGLPLILVVRLGGDTYAPCSSPVSTPSATVADASIGATVARDDAEQGACIPDGQQGGARTNVPHVFCWSACQLPLTAVVRRECAVFPIVEATSPIAIARLKAATGLPRAKSVSCDLWQIKRRTGRPADRRSIIRPSTNALAMILRARISSAVVGAPPGCRHSVGLNSCGIRRRRRRSSVLPLSNSGPRYHVERQAVTAFAWRPLVQGRPQCAVAVLKRTVINRS